MARAPYQDVWRDGRLVTSGRRECAERFELIAGTAGDASSVLDVGGWDGYFPRRFAEAGWSATLVEPRNVAELPAGVVHRQERVDASTGFDRHDLALALSVLHHMEDWPSVYENLRRASTLLIVETPNPVELDGDLSPTLIETGHRIAPIHERVLDEGDQIGVTPGPNGVDRPIVAVHNATTGVVEAGLGRATEVMDGRPEEFWGRLGYAPVAGTLNVRVGQAGKRWVQRLPGPVNMTDEAPGGSIGPYWPVSVGGVDAHVRCSKSRTTVEVVAPVHLRDALDLSDGDRVPLCPR